MNSDQSFHFSICNNLNHSSCVSMSQVCHEFYSFIMIVWQASYLSNPLPQNGSSQMKKKWNENEGFKVTGYLITKSSISEELNGLISKYFSFWKCFISFLFLDFFFFDHLGLELPYLHKWLMINFEFEFA